MRNIQEQKGFIQLRILLFDNTASGTDLENKFSLTGANVTRVGSHEEALEALKETQFSHVLIGIQKPELRDVDMLKQASCGSAKIIVLSYSQDPRPQTQTKERLNKSFGFEFFSKQNLESGSIQPQDLLD